MTARPIITLPSPPSLHASPSADDLVCLAEYRDQVREQVDAYFGSLAAEVGLRDIDDLEAAAERRREDEADFAANRAGWAKARRCEVD